MLEEYCDVHMQWALATLRAAAARRGSRLEHLRSLEAAGDLADAGRAELELLKRNATVYDALQRFESLAPRVDGRRRRAQRLTYQKGGMAVPVARAAASQPPPAPTAPTRMPPASGAPPRYRAAPESSAFC